MDNPELILLDMAKQIYEPLGFEVIEQSFIDYAKYLDEPIPSNIISINRAIRDRKIDEWIATVENYKTRPMFK